MARPPLDEQSPKDMNTSESQRTPAEREETYSMPAPREVAKAHACQAMYRYR